MVKAANNTAGEDAIRALRPAVRAPRYKLLQSLPLGPLLHVVQTEHWLLVRLDVSGLKDPNVEVSCSETVLTVHGRMPDGPFCRKLPLPEGAKVEQAAASVHGGVLRIDVPIRAPAVRQRCGRSVA